MRRAPLPLLAAVLLALGAARALAEDADVEGMMREGRYGEAYEAAVAQDNDNGDAGAKLREAARILLGTSMESDDSYIRWFALRASQPLTEETLATFAQGAMAKGDRYDKSLALDILARLDPAGNRETLETALDSPHRSLRLRALKGLATLKDPALAPRFADIVAKDQDPDLRAFAVRALAQTGSPQAPAGLYRALEDNVTTVQEEAVQALVALESPGLTGVLRQRLADAPPEEKVRAIRLLGFSASTELLGDLGPLLGDGDPEVRAYAASAILSISERAATKRPATPAATAK